MIPHILILFRSSYVCMFLFVFIPCLMVSFFPAPEFGQQLQGPLPL